MPSPALKLTALLLSQREHVIYLEHARVLQKDDRVLYLTRASDELEQYFNIPEKNTALLLLGTGTSITNQAIRKLAESSVVVGFCGTGGSPLHASVDFAFVAPLSEYRPTEYMQAWMQLWLDETRRLEAAKRLLLTRIDWTRTFWEKNKTLAAYALVPPQPLIDVFTARINSAASTTALLTAEAEWAKGLYGLLASTFHLKFKRRSHEEEGVHARVNDFLDHGNYVAYGFAAVALYGLGISYALPLLHGKTRRGGLVFDIADLFKDGLIMPLAFEAGARAWKSNEFRETLVAALRKQKILDSLFDEIKELAKHK